MIKGGLNDLSQWTSKEFQILGFTLEKIIPFIRFLQISSGEFYKKVKPFSTILPIELYEEILQYHLVPGHLPDFELIQPKRAVIDSFIIERKHAATIASWIDGCDLRNSNNNNYDYDISSRGSSYNSCNEEFCSSRNIVSRVREATRAINYYSNYGPSFGRDDLKMAGNFKLDSRCCCKQGDYDFSIRENTGYFSVDEYEYLNSIFSVNNEYI
ncbi:11810_t:CDS:2 [Diversispora eburnea]|uniref:11810_t:CDS:1 n=1 Tax=Diversispora eburnea TaxID=1213867 RepID=A0A9N9B5N8_9GLOM|nr:11810_t:CDS:2 [Diversispora eburnea]